MYVGKYDEFSLLHACPRTLGPLRKIIEIIKKESPDAMNFCSKWKQFDKLY